MLAALRVRVRDRRPLRAPAAVRRGRPDRQQEGARGDRPRHDADPLRRRDARGARRRRHGDEGGPADPARASTTSPPSTRATPSSPTSPSGRSARAATPNAADAGRVVEVIRATLADRYDDDVAGAVRVQYGGSVKPGNIREFMAHPEIDGALVGGASLDPEDLALDREVPLTGGPRDAPCSTSASTASATTRSPSSTVAPRSRPPRPRTWTRSRRGARRAPS